MFKKKPTIKPQAPLRSSDRRKIAQQIIQDLSYYPPGETAAHRNQLLPDGSAAARFTTTQGADLTPVHGTLYSSNRPLWIRTDQFLFPTVFTLWNNPGLLPMLLTHPPVIERLCDGADLMTPGLIGPPFPEGAKVGALVGIASSEHPTVAVAVGVCELDVAGLKKAVGEKGRAVKVLHCVGDEVFKLAGSSVVIPDEVVAAKEEEEEKATAAVEEVTEAVEGLRVTAATSAAAAAVEGEKASDGGEEEVRQLETEEIDGAFYKAALFGFHDYAGKQTALEFPLSSSIFISTLVHPYLPPASHFPPHNYLQNNGPHPSLQLKKTSWKNVAKFLKHLHGKQLVAIKVRSGGETVVLDINWGANEVLSFIPYKLPEAAKEEGGEAGKVAGGPAGMVKVEALFRPNGRGLKFFQEINAGTKDYYTASELKSLLNTYIETNTLAQPNNKRLVKLDPLLSNTLFSTSAADTNELAKAKGIYKRDQLSERLVSACAPYYRITTPSGEEQKPKSGQAPRVSVVMEKRQGKKTVTRIFGLEPFGVEPKTLAEELQRVCAGSATVTQAVGLKPGLLEVMVQGSQSKVVEKALEKRGVPARLVTVVDKTIGKK